MAMPYFFLLPLAFSSNCLLLQGIRCPDGHAGEANFMYNRNEPTIWT